MEKLAMHEPPVLVWLPVDRRYLGEEGKRSPFYVLGEKYALALKHAAQAEPVLFPAARPEALPAMLSMVHGVLLTGSPANVHPSHFGEEVTDPRLPLDPHRDDLTLPLVRACVAQGVPLLGICRGFQEINVALGGSLHQQVHHVEGMDDHREDTQLSYEEQYGLSHPVHLVPGTPFHDWAGAATAQVNSLHGQGVNRLAAGLTAMAHAPDGLVEAFGVEGARSFAYAVQWHPEWQTAQHPFYSAIFAAFARACHQRRRELQETQAARV
jgi:putative glutamine amidotransferase